MNKKSNLHPSLTRRRLLMSLGASAPLLIPILKAERLLAQTAANKKFIYYHTLYGCPHDLFAPNGFGMGGQAAFLKSDVLSPLSAHIQDLNVISGMRFHANNARRGGHRQNASWLTGYPQPNASEEPSKDKDKPATNESIDSFVSRHIGQNKLITLGIGSDGTSFDTLTWTDEAKKNSSFDPNIHFGKVKAIANPVETWKTLFGGGLSSAGGMTQEEILLYVERRGKLFAAIQGDIKSAQRFVSGNEYNKLNLHLEALDSFVKELDPEKIAAKSQCGFTEVTNPAGALDGNERDRVADLQIKMAIEALKCGIASTATIIVGSSNGNQVKFMDQGQSSEKIMTYTGGNTKWHWMSHHAGKENDQNDKRKQSHANIAKWNAGNLEKIISGLKDAGIFGDSLAMWSSGLGNTQTVSTAQAQNLDNVSANGNTHTHYDLPFVMAGSLGGSFNTGKHFKLKNLVNQTSVLAAIGQAFGALAPGERYGDPSYAQDPFSGLMK